MDQSKDSRIQQGVSFIPLIVTIPPPKNYSHLFCTFFVQNQNCKSLNFCITVIICMQFFNSMLQDSLTYFLKYNKRFFWGFSLSKELFFSVRILNSVCFWVSYYHLDWDFTIFLDPFIKRWVEFYGNFYYREGN